MEANILLIRHNQAGGNISGKIGYEGVDDTLTELGIRQALPLGQKLAPILDGHKHIIYVSEAHRTFQTASHAGIINAGASFVRTPALNEIEMGSLIGETLTRENHAIFQKVLGGSDEKFPGGESKNDVKKRMLSFLFPLNPEILHVCITHGVAISAILAHIDPTMNARPKNASITPLRLENGKLLLTTNHL